MLICTECALTPARVEDLVNRAELKLGVRPKLVLLDYVGLMQTEQTSRYERMSAIAESLKTVAKNTGTIIIMASQIGRKKKEFGPEVGLHEGKDSGSLENSAGLVLGCWRDGESNNTLFVQVLKNTKGETGPKIVCNYCGTNHRITERSPISQEDIPATRDEPPLNRAEPPLSLWTPAVSKGCPADQ